MKKQLFSLALNAIILLSATSVNAERLPFLDRMMMSLSPKMPIHGPMFRDADSAEQKTAYSNQLATLILQEAHKVAKEFREMGDEKAYDAFLVLALTVPLQEGLYLHFRETENDGSVCRDDVQNGDLLREKNGGKTTVANFEKYLLEAADEFLAPCDEINRFPVVRQMIRGGDMSDIGIMQVSLRWHAKDFLANQKFRKVRSTLNYGLNHLMNGFKPIYRNFEDYSCLRKGMFWSRKPDYEGLVKGTWAGKYNSGNIGSTCRFDDRSNAYKAHDEHYAKNLDKVLGLADGKDVDVFNGFSLSTSGTVKEALTNIVSKFQDPDNKNVSYQALDKLLKQ